jgi:regulator of nucleoside diphosphate kinase
VEINMQSHRFDDLVIKQSDCEKLLELAASARTAVAEKLEDELVRADIVADRQYPEDAVCMGSTVSYVEVASGKEGRVTLVYPWEANVDEMRISVLVPLGCALIGLRAGGVIDWTMPNGSSAQIKVLSVLQHRPQICTGELL